MTYDPKTVPNPSIYQVWYNERKARAHEAHLAGRKRITGQEIRAEGISLKALYNLGYSLETETDTMVKT